MWLESSYFYGECKLLISNFFPRFGRTLRKSWMTVHWRDVCSIGADIDCSSTKVYTALPNVKPRTLILALCVVLTWTSDTHTCMYNSKLPSSQLAAHLHQHSRPSHTGRNDSTFTRVLTCTFSTFNTNQMIQAVSVR
jgi:hypothetical protein